MLVFVVVAVVVIFVVVIVVPVSSKSLNLFKLSSSQPVVLVETKKGTLNLIFVSNNFQF